MHPLYRIVLLIVAVAAACRSLAAEDRPLSKLAFTRAEKELHFDTGVLKGTLGAEGKALGLRPVTHVATGAQIGGAFGILSPYRLLTADARFGTAAWDWANTWELQADGAARIHWSADKEHPLEMTGVYRWSAADTLDLELFVKPQRDLHTFELFLASYFNGFPSAQTCVRLPGAPGGLAPEFREAAKADGDWLTFPRDSAVVRTFADGRWKRPPNPVNWKMMPGFAVPLALRYDAKSGLTALLMSRPADCFAVSMPYGEDPHRSVYLSLFGCDLKAGKVKSASARLVVGKDISKVRAVELYQDYVSSRRDASN